MSLLLFWKVTTLRTEKSEFDILHMIRGARSYKFTHTVKKIL